MKNEHLHSKRALRTALLVLLLGAVGTTKANPVDMNTAREVGFKFINANVTPMRGVNDLQLVTTYNISRGDAAFYIFNTPNGFVIVSADDCATPILGYSNEGQFDIEDIPIQMQDYLQDFVEQIQYGIENHIVADADIARQWELVQATGRLTEQRATRIVDPLLSEKWHQNCYYNEKCPVDPAGPCGRVWAGCAATAMGQIMHYWRHPMTGTGSFSYTPSGYPEQSADFGATTYQWDNMPDRLYSTSDSTAIDAVSTLLWHCGVSVRMSYGVGESAGGSCPDALAALRDHFRYSNDMHVERENFHPFTWENRLKSCLNDSIPLYYIGHNDTAQISHAFVCDGYDADDFFHFNWGWNGSYNNYFALYAMTPGDHNYNRNHIAIFDIRPNYQVLATCSPSYGGLVSGSGSYINNSSCTLTAIPKSGFSFSHWKEGNDIVSYATIYTFTVKCNRNLVAVFTPLRTITTSSNPTNGGTVSGGGSYPQGCPCTVNATANNGYTFTNWTENGTQVSTNASYTFTVTGNRSLVANFTVQSSQTYTISVSANPTNGGSVSGGGNYQQGQSCTVTATANSGYTFTNWTENGTQVSTNANYTFNVTGNRNLVANFTSSAPPPQTYAITVSANPTNGGSVTGGNTYQQGASCTVTATPATGYSFQKWTVNGVQVSTNANYTFTVTGNRSLVAHFQQSQSSNIVFADANVKSLCVSNWDTNGDGELSYTEAAAVTDLNSVFENNSVITNFDELQYFIGLTSIGEDEFENCSRLASIVIPNSMISIGTTAFFNCSGLTSITVLADDPPYLSFNAFFGVNKGIPVNVPCGSLEAYENANGWNEFTNIQENCGTTCTISASANPSNGGSVSGGGNYQQGQSCTVTATPATGYSFQKWTENGIQVSTNANYTFNVTSNRNLVAHFTSTAPPPPPQTYTITVSANPSIGGSVSGGGTYQQGASCTVTATPAADYSFQKWTVNGAQVSTSASYTFNVTGNCHLVAHFTSTAPPPPQTYTINATSSPIYGGSASGGGTYQQGASCTLTASADNGYAFDYWTENGNVVHDQAIYTFTVNCNRNLVAHFHEITYHVTVSANPTDGGTVTGAGYYYYDEYCTVTATANYGYDFVNWTRYGNEVSTNPDYTFLVHGGCSFVANFQPQSFTITTTSNSSEYGIVAGDGIYDYGQECTLTATANDGCVFTNWTENDSVVSTDANYTFTITGDRNLVANFQAQSSIVFADTNVKTICVGVANWDTNGDSQLSYDEAASVTSLGQVFMNTEITSFEELQYFIGLTSIDNYAFQGCSGLTGNLIIPNSVTSIGSYAFLYCSGFTGNLIIPSSVTTIGNGAFRGCSGFTGDLVIPNSVTSIGEHAFAHCNGFTGSLIIPNSVTTIGNYAFYNCNGFTGSLTISNSLTIIGARAFYDCWGLTGNLTLPNSVTTIGQDAFNGCSGFNGNLTIPNSVSSIGSAAFCDCTGITSITVQAETPQTINSMTFYNCPKSIPVYVPCESVEAYQSADFWSEFTHIQAGWYSIAVSYVEAGGSVTGAGNYCLGDTCTLTATTNDGYTFQYWTKDGNWVSDLQTYSFMVTQSANYMAHFESVEGENIVFADTIVKAICVANWDANGDGELSYVEAASVTSLGQVFSGNTEITSFEELQYFIGLTTIGSCAFQGCSGLTGNLFIPNSVTSIDAKAFQNCSGLTGHLIIPNSVTSIEGLAFYNCSGLTGNLIIPNSVTLIDSYAFYNCRGFSSLTIGNSVVMIDRAAFYNCNGLASLTIGSSVTSIVDEAFYNCRHLHSITILAETPPTIQSSLVFYYCHKDIPVYVPCGSLEAYQSAAYWNEFSDIQESCSQYTLSEGWNWVSSSVEITLSDLQTALVAAYPNASVNSLIIKSNGNGQTAWNPAAHRWIGGLNTLDLSQMYMIKVVTAGEITLGGMPINPAEHPATIANGNNWIAFPLGESMTVTNAFAGFPVNGDVVKSNTGGQATWNSTTNRWIGGLTTLEPGKGYIYNSKAAENREFTFPASVK